MANFNSTNNIAAAGLLTGATLASNVLASSLTSVGTLTSLTMGGTLAMSTNSITITGSIGATGARVTKGWFTDLEVTNPIVGATTLISSAAETTDTTCFPLFITASGTQSLQAKNTTGLTFNSNTNNLATTTFTGALVGNASTATILQTARTINGVAFDGSANITITANPFTWNTTSGTSATLAVNNGYFANNAGVVTYTLPTTAAVGDEIVVAYQGAGGWAIAQNALQSIVAGNVTSTVGTGGSIASTAAGDNITLVCQVANTTFIVTDGIGNLTVV